MLIPVIADFLTILLSQAGIKSQDRILTLNFVNRWVAGNMTAANYWLKGALENRSVTSFIGALTGTAIVDRVGRRKVSIAANEQHAYANYQCKAHAFRQHRFLHGHGHCRWTAVTVRSTINTTSRGRGDIHLLVHGYVSVRIRAVPFG